MTDPMTPPQSTGFAAPTDESVAGLAARPVAWQTRGMTIRNEWAGWVQCSEAQAQSWERDVSFRIGRREVRALYDANALSTLAAERDEALAFIGRHFEIKEANDDGKR